ncbi:tyrosine-type recombinase/integrase [Crateriforma conspicua]|uniref:tyrosine-type recombinase/integrase n=1 Tax=Crateriforma conspicua TaxID=2527996 RepID=UPI0011A96420
MATLFKKTTTRPMPAGAKIVSRTVKGETKRFAQWTDRKGKRRTAELTEAGDRIKTEASTWTAKYRDGEGKVCEVATGCRDKQAAQSVLDDLVKRSELVRANVMTPEQDAIADHAAIPLSSHLAAFLNYHRMKKTNADRIKTYETRLNESADACRFRRLIDLSADRLERWLYEQVDGERNMSESVFNGYVEAWNNFANWCCGRRGKGKRSHSNGEKRLMVNPFKGMTKLDERANPRRKARALTGEELSRLLEATKQRPLNDARTIRRGPRKDQLAAKVEPQRWVELLRLGRERALIYKTFVLTGLRADELRTLECRDLSFGDVPFVRLRHSNEKSRKGSTVPLRSDLAAELRAWTLDRQPGDRVFAVPDGILRIMNRDLAAAGIPKVDADGCVVHVHALRHSFGTHLSRAGVAPRVAQAAMRHSKLELTMTTYTDARLLDTAGAVESLPIVRDHNEQMVAPTVAPNQVQPSQIQSIAGHSDHPAPKGQTTKKPRKTLGFAGFSKVEDNGLEPMTSTMPL